MDLGHVLLILAGVVGGGINALAGEGSRAGLTGRWRRIRAALPVCVAGATARCRADARVRVGLFDLALTQRAGAVHPLPSGPSPE
ncbi:hypothetical protein ACWEWX_42350, partial [Streptomyces asiaticus]